MKTQKDRVLLDFKQELLDLGFQFQVLNQVRFYMPKYKDIIVPIVCKYYRKATVQEDKFQLLEYLRYKGLDDVIPMLLNDFYSADSQISNSLKWHISDALYSIRSRKFTDDYLKIISNPCYGVNRQLIVLLVGEIKLEPAIPILIEILEDEVVRLHAICALGDFKREEFRVYFERFKDSKHSGWRKYSRRAIEKLDKQLLKNSELK